jgi:hypothetical protein
VAPGGLRCNRWGLLQRRVSKQHGRRGRSAVCPLIRRCLRRTFCVRSRTGAPNWAERVLRSRHVHESDRAELISSRRFHHQIVFRRLAAAWRGERLQGGCTRRRLGTSRLSGSRVAGYLGGTGGVSVVMPIAMTTPAPDCPFCLVGSGPLFRRSVTPALSAIAGADFSVRGGIGVGLESGVRYQPDLNPDVSEWNGTIARLSCRAEADEGGKVNPYSPLSARQPWREPTRTRLPE